jgi:hypothetical protein
MRKTLGLVLAIALVIPACGGSGSDPSSADSCEELADVAIVMLQDALDSLAGLGIDEVPEEMPEAFEKLEEIDTRAEELGCSDAQGEELLCERIGRLRADGAAAEFFLVTLTDSC